MLKQLKIQILVTCVALSGCASPAVVPERQAGDESLTCDQLIAALKETSEFEKNAREERGFTGTNAAAAVFFWPGLLATYVNTDDAIDAAKDREEYLTGLYAQKNCAASAKGSSSDIAGQLRDLQSMHEEGLLTNAEYAAARSKVLGD